MQQESERKDLRDDPSLTDFVPEWPAPASAPEPFVARSGSPRPGDAATLASEDVLIEAMRTVYDPEIPVNVYDLGLVYDVSLAENGDVAIKMTLTAPGCPVAGELPGWVADAVAAVDGVGEVEVALVWDPPWSPDRMSDDAKLALGF